MVNPKKRKSKQYKTLLSVLACGSTPESRRLLKDTTGEDAFSENDLEVKLANLYATSDSKLDLEKEFAQIHPHKEFILKYCQLESSRPSVDLANLNSSNTEVIKQMEIITPPTKEETEKVTEGKGCACGCGKYSNADGDTQQKGINPTTMAIAILGLVSVIAITSTILLLKNRNK